MSGACRGQPSRQPTHRNQSIQIETADGKRIKEEDAFEYVVHTVKEWCTTTQPLLCD